jgi:two-component system nitrate/nitrite sensor histidine kinase NarX
MRTRATLTTKLLAMGLGFLLFTLTSIGVTLWVTWKLEGGAAAVNEAGRLRMNTMRMALAVESGPRGELLQRIEKMDASLQLLETGDPAHPLFVPWSADTRARFAQVRAQWAEVRASCPRRRPAPSCWRAPMR